MPNRKRQTARVDPHMHTFQALHKWHCAMFEKLGWMLLAKEHGYHEKIHAYKASIHYLCDALERKIRQTREMDRKNDLKILLKNTHVLMDHVAKDF
jgi:hypothetical protein